MTIAVMFPGQGSQVVGMGHEAMELAPRTITTWGSADQILGRSITSIIEEGPKQSLDNTANAQPALFLVNQMYWEALAADGFKPDYLLGHSLGELSAAAAAGVFTFTEGLQIVDERARLMALAAAENPGGMLAVLGLELEAVEEISETQQMEIANINSPGQIVVAGPADKLLGAEASFKERGAKRVVRLAVSGPFHSSAMTQAAELFSEFLEPIDFANADIPVISNVTGRPVTNGKDIKGLLVDQIVSRVRWMDSVNWLAERGVEEIIEAGPGKVLGGIVKRISSSVSVSHVREHLSG